MARLAQAPKLHAELLNLTRRALFRSLQHAVLLGRMNAHQRVAAFLLDMAALDVASMAAARMIELPMNRLDIADYLGLTIESVSRELTRFKREGKIATSGSHRIELLHIEGLRATLDRSGRK